MGACMHLNNKCQKCQVIWTIRKKKEIKSLILNPIPPKSHEIKKDIASRVQYLTDELKMPLTSCCHHHYSSSSSSS